MSELLLRETTADGVLTLVLNRPEKKNALSLELAGEIRRALAEAAGDDAVRATIVTGRGDAFTGGADVSIFLRIGEADPEELRKMATIHEALLGFPKPLIAAVQGKAVGMGVTLLPCFDLVYAAESATFQTPFVRLGLVLEYGSSFTLPRLIGRQRTNELILRAKPIDARTAADWGLVTRVFPDAELMPRVLDIATDLAALPPGAVRESKRLIREGEESLTLSAAFDRENEALAARYGSPENVAAVMAFLEKRVP